MSALANITITLHDLAAKGDIETFQTISLHKVDINERDENGYTPLMISACHGHREFSRYLLGLGADASSVDLNGNSILTNLVKRGKYEIIKHIIEAGADLSFTNSEGKSALELAKESGRLDIAELIRERLPKEPGFLSSIKYSSYSSAFTNIIGNLRQFKRNKTDSSF